MGALSMPPRQRFAPHVCSPTTFSYTLKGGGPYQLQLYVSPQSIANKRSPGAFSPLVTIQMPDSSPPAAARVFFEQRAWQPQAAMPAAQKTLASCRSVPIYLVV